MRRLARLALLTLLVAPACYAADATVEIVDKAEAAKFLPDQVVVEKLGSGMKFTEGPVWFGPGQGPAAKDAPDGYLLFSDIPNNLIKRWTPKDGLTTFRENSGGTNGNGRDAEGRLLSCEGSNRRLTRTEKNGQITVLADECDGKKLSSPNDVAVDPAGNVYFTDPTYGMPKGATREQPANHVFRLDPKTLRIAPVAADFDMPNGLAFSPDFKTLYVADSGKPKHIRALPVQADGTLGAGKVFCTIDKGAPDGIKVDADGRVFSSSDDGVQVFSPAGQLVARILVPEPAANLVLGGPTGNDLFVTARTSLYRVKLKPAADAGARHAAVIEGMIGTLTDLTTTMKTVTDEPTSKAAAPKVKALIGQLKSYKTQADALPPAGPAGTADLQAKNAKPLAGAMQAFQAETLRIANNPALLTPELREAFVEMTKMK